MPSTRAPLWKMAGSTVGLAWIVNAIRAAGDDQTGGAREIGRGSFAGADLGVDSQVANFTRDQVTVLASGIQYDDLGGGLHLARTGIFRLHALNEDLAGRIQQRLGLGHGVDGPFHFGIGFHGDAVAFIDVEGGDVHFALEQALDPVGILGEFGFREIVVLFQQIVVEFVQGGGVGRPALGQLGVVLAEVVAREVEERRLHVKLGLELVDLGRGVLFIGGDAAAAIDGAAAIGHLDVLHVLGFVLVIVVIEERLIGVIALDEAAAGCIEMGRGERQAGVFGERIDGLHQPFAESGFAQYPAAIVILQGAGDNLGGGSRRAVHQHDDGILMPVVAVAGGVSLFRRGAAVVGNDGLPFLQELVGHGDAFVEQAAGVGAQIEDQAVDVVLAELFQRVLEFLAGGFVELLDEDVGDAGLQPDGVLHAAREISSRMTVKVRGWSLPSRETTMATCVPRGPFSRSATSVVVRLSVGLSFTFMMMSPGRMPAR
jgi:hypothetical protein